MRLASWFGIGCASFAGLAAARRLILAFQHNERLDAALLSAAPDVAAWGLTGLGGWLAATGWPYREGRTLHCAGCDFEFERETRKLIEFCPECKACWRWYGGVKRGRLMQSMPRFMAGMALLLLVFTAWNFRDQAWRAALRRMSTPALARLVVTAPWHDLDDAWDELAGRKLTPDAQLRLGHDLLSKRSADGYLPEPVNEWIRGAGAATGGEELARRYYSELIRTHVDIPERVDVGSHLQMSARSEYRADSASWEVMPVTLAVEGVYINGELVEGSRQTHMIPPGFDPEHLPAIATASIPCDRAGTARVRIVYWIVADVESYSSVSWWQTGPYFASTPAWSKQFFIERTVEIVDPFKTNQEPLLAQ